MNNIQLKQKMNAHQSKKKKKNIENILKIQKIFKDVKKWDEKVALFVGHSIEMILLWYYYNTLL